VHLSYMWAGKESPAQVAEISQKIREELEAMNRLALQRLLFIEER